MLKRYRVKVKQLKLGTIEVEARSRDEAEDNAGRLIDYDFKEACERFVPDDPDELPSLQVSGYHDPEVVTDDDESHSEDRRNTKRR